MGGGTVSGKPLPVMALAAMGLAVIAGAIAIRARRARS
jgi:hypothetical protein